MIDEQKLKSIYKPHLRGQLEQGQAVLFTGAGFSRGANNILGNPLPGVGELIDTYSKICYPDSPVDEGATLQDLYDAANSQHHKNLTETTTQILSVEGGSIPDWYQIYFSMPWIRSYTLNIDDLAEAASRHFDLPRRCFSVSAAKRRTTDSDAARTNQLEIVHLHGRLEDLPDDVTFSVTQYADRLANSDPWYLRLVTELMNRCFVFVGTSLDEPPLWQHLVMREARGGRGISEHRHRSYLVTPTLPLARQALLEKYNIVWLPYTAEEFSRKILEPMHDVIPAGQQAIQAQIPTAKLQHGGTLSLVSDLACLPMEKTEYLMGQTPRWSDIQSGRAAVRQCDASITKVVNCEIQKTKVKQPILITGTAGSGKSTALMRICMELASMGTRIGWFDRTIDYSPRTILRSMEAPDGPTVLAMDDADVFGTELSSLLRDLVLSDRHPLVLLEIRSGRVDRVLNDHILKGIKPVVITMPLLEDVDIGAIIDVLEGNNRLGTLRGKKRTEQEAAFRENAGRELIVAMYKATTGLEFKEKMVEEMMELEGTQRFIYSLVALASSYRFPITKDEIIIAIGDRSNTALNEIDKLISLHLLVIERDGESLGTRHRIIAKTLVDALKTQGGLYDLIFGLLLAAATKTVDNLRMGSRPHRMLRTFMNHDFLYEVLELDQCRNIYDECEQLLTDNFHYWLHRGSLEVEHGDLSLAENFLSQARGIAPADVFVLNEWAYLLFKKAIKVPGSLEAPELVEEATKLLSGLIATTDKNVYPYHVLGSQGLAWARRGIADPDDRASYLRELHTQLEKACVKYSGNKELQQLTSDLQREYLLLASK